MVRLTPQQKAKLKELLQGTEISNANINLINEEWNSGKEEEDDWNIYIQNLGNPSKKKKTVFNTKKSLERIKRERSKETPEQTEKRRIAEEKRVREEAERIAEEERRVIEEDQRRVREFEELKGPRSTMLQFEHNENINNKVNNIKHNCFILGHGTTINNKYIITPENIDLKFYTPKGTILSGSNSSIALSSYATNGTIDTNTHYLFGDSITHNMTIKLLSIFKYQKCTSNGTHIFGNCTKNEYNSINKFTHSGLVVGKKLISFYNIKRSQYETMGIRMFKINVTIGESELEYKILDFGDNIYGIIEKGDDYITIVNTMQIMNEEIQERYDLYCTLVKIVLEKEFARTHYYGTSDEYNPKMKEKVQELIDNVTFPPIIPDRIIDKITHLSYYNHIKNNNNIISFKDIKDRNFSINLGELFHLITEYNERKQPQNKITLCQGLICRSWDATKKKKVFTSSSSSSSSSSLYEEENLVNISTENNIGYARLTRQSSNTGNYRNQFSNIRQRCNNSVESNNINESVTNKYRHILQMYENTHHLPIKAVNFLVNLANRNIANIKSMEEGIVTPPIPLALRRVNTSSAVPNAFATSSAVPNAFATSSAIPNVFTNIFKPEENKRSTNIKNQSTHSSSKNTNKNSNKK